MPSDKKDPTEQEIYIEEKKNKPNGEVETRKYTKGRFLGKVSKFMNFSTLYIHYFLLFNDINSYFYRADLQNVMNFNA